MDTRAVVTLSVTVLIAVAGYLATYLNNLRLARRKDRLDRVSQQLSDFYGPLLTLSSASGSSWVEFMDRYRPGASAFWNPVDPPTEKQAELFRLWIRHVFMPLNLRMVDVVTNNADLLIEPDIPQCLLDLCAHVASYEAILKRWEGNDFSENTTGIPVPGREIIHYAEAGFGHLKAEQNELPGVSARA